MFNVGNNEIQSMYAATIKRASDDASLDMEIESLDQDELRRLVSQSVDWSLGR